MKKDVTPVPKDKFLLNLLADMGDQTKNAWIFLHHNDMEKLSSIADNYFPHGHSNFQEFRWNATDDFPERLIWVELQQGRVWLKVLRIEAKNIPFNLPADDPDDILFLKMDE